MIHEQVCPNERCNVTSGLNFLIFKNNHDENVPMA